MSILTSYKEFELRREDRVAFATTFTIFTLFIFSISYFSEHTFSDISCMEKCKVSLQACTMKTCIKIEAKVLQKKVIKKTKPIVKKEQEPVTNKKAKLVKSEPLKEEKSILEAKEKISENSQQAVEKTQDSQIIKKSASATIMDARARFFKKIKEEINSNKTYPRIALRRSIEGEVKISFTIFSDGKIKITELSGNRFFKQNSKDALLETFPITIPKELKLTFPLNLSVDLKYQLS